jgi:hypothetical protein
VTLNTVARNACQCVSEKPEDTGTNISISNSICFLTVSPCVCSWYDCALLHCCVVLCC